MKSSNSKINELNVFTFISSENYELCHPEDTAEFEHFSAIGDGISRIATWKPVSVQLIRFDEGRDLAESDSPWLGAHAPIFRRRAVEVLRPLLSTHGEFLPLQCQDAELWLFSATRILDALDEGAPRLHRFHSGRNMGVTQYSFRATVIGDVRIFKLSNLTVSPTFVTQSFVDTWQAAGLRGLEFDHLWSVRVAS